MDFKKEKFIYQKNNSITQYLIYEIISNYKELNMYFKKDNIDKINDTNNLFLKIKNVLKNEINKNINCYINNINNLCVINKTQNYNIQFSVLPNSNDSNDMKFSDFLIKQNIYNISDYTPSEEFETKDLDGDGVAISAFIGNSERGTSVGFPPENGGATEKGEDESYKPLTFSPNVVNINTNEKSIINNKRIIFLYEDSGKTTRIKKFHFIWFLNEYEGEIIFWNNYSIKPLAGKLLIFPASWCFPFFELTKFNQTIFTISGFIYE